MMMKLTTKSQTDVRQPEQLPISEQKDEKMFVSQHTSKSFVVRSLFYVNLRAAANGHRSWWETQTNSIFVYTRQVSFVLINCLCRCKQLL
jgi:hypothetical protein